jgi:peroxiredoxin
MSTKSSTEHLVQNKTRSNLLKWIIPFILILGALGIWIALSALPRTLTTTPKSGVEVGDIASDFTVPTLDGAKFTLSEGRGKPTIVFFTAYWCSDCFPKAQKLGQLYQEYSGRVNIIALDIDPTSTLELLGQFKQAAGNGPFVWAFDSDSKVATAYQVTSTGTTIIIDREGRIVYRGGFPTSYDVLKGELEKLIQ